MAAQRQDPAYRLAKERPRPGGVFPMYALRGRSVLDVLASYDDLWYSSVMVVKDRPEVFEVLDRAEAALREATSDVERTKAILEMVREKPGITVAELASQFHLSEEAVIAFVQTVGEILGADRSLSVEAARRGGLLAAASQAWENELGPLLGTAEVRELLGVSRQRVDELLRSKRLIAPATASTRRFSFTTASRSNRWLLRSGRSPTRRSALGPPLRGASHQTMMRSKVCRRWRGRVAGGTTRTSPESLVRTQRDSTSEPEGLPAANAAGRADHLSHSQVSTCPLVVLLCRRRSLRSCGHRYGRLLSGGGPAGCLGGGLPQAPATSGG